MNIFKWFKPEDDTASANTELTNKTQETWEKDIKDFAISTMRPYEFFHEFDGCFITIAGKQYSVNEREGYEESFKESTIRLQNKELNSISLHFTNINKRMRLTMVTTGGVFNSDVVWMNNGPFESVKTFNWNE